MLRDAARIDWRSQLGALESLVDRGHGIAHVQAGLGSPASAFARTLEGLLVERGFTCVRIDPNDSATHYLRNALEEIGRQLGVPLATHPVTAPPIDVDVARDIQSGGSVSVREINVVIEQPGPSAFLSDSTLAIELAAELGPRLSAQPLALLFFDSHDHSNRALRAFGRDFWNNAFSLVLEEGLLLVDISDPARLHAKDEVWPPSPDIVVVLPDLFDEVARQAAEADLVAFALAEGYFGTEAEASAFAGTLLSASDNIRDLHARLARFVANARRVPC